MDNCKHGNGPDCQQCQYERDVASGYPEPWRLWEVSRYGAGFQGYCSSKENPLSGILNNKYRRRHDADEMIREWEREQKRKLLQPDLENIPDIFQSDELFQCPYNNCRCDLKEPCRECEAFIEFVSDIQGKYKKIEDYFDNVSPEQLSKDIKSVMTQPAPCGPWISVEDGLPEEDGYYYVHNMRFGMEAHFCSFEDKKVWMSPRTKCGRYSMYERPHDCILNNVTHWQTLPPSPEAS